ncbi:MAG: shikimate dehydrogenase [Candidatus Margulisbacteria bacterium]|nr:shikimate dehydrogenase [Candidatus Margulisiibacteriota bacterium]
MDGNTNIIGIFGNPIEHTASPAMHTAAFEKLKLNYAYIPFLVHRSKISTAIESIRALNIKGVNVTAPFKESVIPYLDNLSIEAKLIGAVNTIKNENGVLTGYNTDGLGFIESLKDLSKKFSPKGKKVVIIGAGGAARALGITLAQKKIKELTIGDLLENKAKNLAQYIKTKLKINAKGMAPNTQQFYNQAEASDLIINATSVGMHPKTGESPLSNISVIHPRQLVCDLIYNPEQTKFLKLAKHLGAKTQNGFGMLLYQGVIAFEIFTGKKAPVSVMRKALLKQII